MDRQAAMGERTPPHLGAHHPARDELPRGPPGGPPARPPVLVSAAARRARALPAGAGGGFADSGGLVGEGEADLVPGLQGRSPLHVAPVEVQPRQLLGLGCRAALVCQAAVRKTSHLGAYFMHVQVDIGGEFLTRSS